MKFNQIGGSFIVRIYNKKTLVTFDKFQVDWIKIDQNDGSCSPVQLEIAYIMFNFNFLVNFDKIMVASIQLHVLKRKTKNHIQYAVLWGFFRFKTNVVRTLSLGHRKLNI